MRTMHSDHLCRIECPSLFSEFCTLPNSQELWWTALRTLRFSERSDGNGKDWAVVPFYGYAAYPYGIWSNARTHRMNELSW